MRQQTAAWLDRISTWALAGLLATLPFWRNRVLVHRPGDPVFFEFHDITLFTSDLFLLGALAAWLLSRAAGQPKASLRLGPRFVWGPLVGLLIVSAVGIPFAFDPLYAGYQALRLALLFALYLLLVNRSLPPGVIAGALIAAMVVQAIAGVPQFALGRTLDLGWLGEVTVQATWPGASVVMVGEDSWLRAYGLTQHPNLLAGCLMAMLLVVGGYYLVQRGWKRLAVLLGLGIGCVALLLTFSRAAWLGALFGALAVLALLRRTRRQSRRPLSRSSVALLAVSLLAVGGAFVALNWPLLRPRFGLIPQGTEIQSVVARLNQIPPALAMIRARPALGVGLGNYSTALYRLSGQTTGPFPEYQPVFNVLLLITAELGIAGAPLWLILLLAPWLALWRARDRLAMTSWWAGLCGALLALSLVSLFDFYVWTSHQGPLMLWTVLGLWAREWEGANHYER